MNAIGRSAIRMRCGRSEVIAIMKKNCIILLLVLIRVFGDGSCDQAWAHPFHTTTAEMEFNAETGRLEVALKIAAVDFEQLVQGGTAMVSPNSGSLEVADSTIRLGKEPVRERLAARYLEKQFMVTIEGKPCRFEWVGVEDEIANKWLYFEIILPNAKSTSGELTLTNKVLCDRNNNQINTVVFISKAKRVSLKTHEQSSSVTLPKFQ